MVFRQVLSALVYLSKHEPPILHRDIKPDNILVQTRDPLHVKLSDFGLAKAGGFPQTIVGTRTYLAPEILMYDGKAPTAPTYTPVADLWSLGVVIFTAMRRIAKRHQPEGVAFCDRIISSLQNGPSDDLLDILKTILVKEPEERKSAEDCLNNLERLFLLLRMLGRPKCPFATQGDIPRQIHWTK